MIRFIEFENLRQERVSKRFLQSKLEVRLADSTSNVE